MKQYQVWECKIVVPGDVALPDSFDQPPRCAAIDAVASVVGTEAIVACFSGWNGRLTVIEREIADEDSKRVKKGVGNGIQSTSVDQ